MRVCAKYMLCVVLVTMIFTVSGCFCGDGQFRLVCHGAGETTSERSMRQTRQFRLQNEMLIEDVDAVFMTDRPSRLSEHTIR